MAVTFSNLTTFRNAEAHALANYISELGVLEDGIRLSSHPWSIPSGGFFFCTDPRPSKVAR